MASTPDTTDRRMSDEGEQSPTARFELVNRDRLQRVLACLGPRQEALVRSLPLLFHVNHPLLPGYAGLDAPCGVSDYSPDRSTLAATRQLARNFAYEQRMFRSFAVLGLYLMGSPGTIAHTRDSDLDLWLVHDPGLAPEAVQQLQEKASRIEHFAAQLGLEVHFFVFDTETFRRGATLEMSAESSGSSQHYLLLDEFYRSSILLAGLMPMWWAVPPDQDHRYSDYVAEALHSRKLQAQRFVDFGGLEEIPAGEFFGATVWQLYKSIESPFKSVLKLLLMEAYAANFPDTAQLLSHRYKRALVQNDVTLDQLDPYVALYRRVEDYLRQSDDEVRLRVLRRALYLKAAEALSSPADARSPVWRRSLVQQLVDEWGWGKFEILHLDQRPQWRLENAQEERRDLVKALQKSYSALSDFARLHGDNRITEADLGVLGRKLYAAFDRKPNKLELLTRGLCAAPEEPELSLHQLTFEKAGTQWVLYKGGVTPNDLNGKTPLYRAPSQLEVLSWCFFNRLNSPQTIWHCFVAGRRQPASTLRRLLETLEQRYPERSVSTGDSQALSLPPRVLSASFFVNFSGDTPSASGPDRGVIASNRTDAFQFGGRRVNLVKSVGLVLETSWEELFSFHFEGDASPLQAACEYLNRLGASSPQLDPAPRVYCFDPDYGPLIAQRMTRFLHELTAAREGVNDTLSSVVAVRLGEKIFDLTLEDSGTHYRAHDNLASLVKVLGEPASGFKRVRFDQACAPDAPFHCIYPLNEPGTLQIFGLLRTDRLDVFVLGTDGSLVGFVHQDTDVQTFFSHLRQFFESAHTHAAGFEEAAERAPLALRFALLQRRAPGEFTVQPVIPSISARRHFLPLRLFVDLDDAATTSFVAYLDNREFSSAEHGPGLFAAIAGAVQSLRASGGKYPVFITDLELSDRLLRARELEHRPLLEVLRQKLRIERKLSQALLALGATGAS